jgi:hypothetical protein
MVWHAHADGDGTEQDDGRALAPLQRRMRRLQGPHRTEQIQLQVFLDLLLAQPRKGLQPDAARAVNQAIEALWQTLAWKWLARGIPPEAAYGILIGYLFRMP